MARTSKSPPPKSASLVLLVVGCLGACGGTVVFEEEGGGGDGGSDVTSDVTSTAATTRPSSSVSSVTSTSTGLGDCFPDSHHPCDGGATCILIGQVCDGSQDCADASDELGCEQPCFGTDFTCNDGTCIAATFECDGVADCAGGEDESPVACCGEGTLPCFDERCVLETDICDGQLECSAGEDEFPEICGGQLCGLDLFVADPVDAYCISRFCCDSVTVCFGDDPDACLDCLGSGGGPICDEVVACVASFCDLEG